MTIRISNLKLSNELVELSIDEQIKIQGGHCDPKITKLQELLFANEGKEIKEVKGEIPNYPINHPIPPILLMNTGSSSQVIRP
jgi:hypothetical protein